MVSIYQIFALPFSPFPFSSVFWGGFLNLFVLGNGNCIPSLNQSHDEISPSASNRTFLIKAILDYQYNFIRRNPDLLQHKCCEKYLLNCLKDENRLLRGLLKTCFIQAFQGYFTPLPFPDLDGQAVIIKTSSKIARSC